VKEMEAEVRFIFNVQLKFAIYYLETMKKALVTVCIGIALTACNSKPKHKKDDLGDTTKKELKTDTSVSVNDTARKRTINDMGEKLPGIWAAVGDENATFVITKGKIAYPGKNKSFKYALKDDSLHIRYDGYDRNYLVTTRGSDTLILTGDEKQVYYRFKK
jgi:hypothetical protein